MDRVKLFALVLFFLLPSAGVFAATPVTLETGLFFDAAGTMWYKTVGGQNTLMYPDLQISKSVPVQTNYGSKDVAITRQPRIDLPRVGASVVGFAKLLGPIGVGISLAQLICSQSKICDSGSGTWQKSADAAVAGFPSTLSGNFYWYSPSNSPADGSGKYPTATASCAALNAALTISQPSLAPYTWILSGETLSAANCASKNVLNQTTNYTMTRANNSGCPISYNLVGGQCVLVGNPTPSPASETDWNAAKTALSTSNLIQPLLDAAQPIPVYVPPVVPPISQVIDTTSTTNPDGTRTDTTTTLTTTDTSSASAPNSYTINETTTTTIYNISNEVINTTVTNTNPPAVEVAPSSGGDTSLLARETTLQEVRNALTTPTMPELSTTTTTGNTALDTASGLVTSLIGSQSGVDKKTDLGWSFLPQLPSGSCATVPFGVRSWLVNYDWCTDLGKARTMWGWLFAMLGALYIWRRGTAALSGQS